MSQQLPSIRRSRNAATEVGSRGGKEQWSGKGSRRMGEARLRSAAFSSGATRSRSAGQSSSTSSGWHRIAAKQSALRLPFPWLRPRFGCRKPAERTYSASVHQCRQWTAFPDIPCRPTSQSPVQKTTGTTTRYHLPARLLLSTALQQGLGSAASRNHLFPPFFSLLVEHRGGKQAFCSSRCAWAASFSQVCPCAGQAGRNPGPSDLQAAGCQWQCLRKKGKTFFFTPKKIKLCLLKVMKWWLIFVHNELWNKRQSKEIILFTHLA